MSGASEHAPGVSRALAEHAAGGRPGPAALADAARGLAAVRAETAAPAMATQAAFQAALRTGFAVAAAGSAAAALADAGEAAVTEAVAIGLEVGRGVETALAASPSRRAWPPGSVEAWLGAAAAAGRVLRLDTDRMLAALALACTQATGIDPSGALRTRFAKAAQDGVEAALLAEAGFTAPESPVEGRRGLAALTAPGADLSALGRSLAGG